MNHARAGPCAISHIILDFINQKGKTGVESDTFYSKRDGILFLVFAIR